MIEIFHGSEGIATEFTDSLSITKEQEPLTSRVGRAVTTALPSRRVAPKLNFTG